MLCKTTTLNRESTNYGLWTSLNLLLSGRPDPELSSKCFNFQVCETFSEQIGCAHRKRCILRKIFRDTSSMPQKVWYGSKTFFEAFQCDIKAFILKVLSQVWDNFWQLKELQKWWRMMVFIRKLFPLSRYLNFRLDFLVLYKNSLINVKIVNGLMWKLWRRILVKKQLQYTYWPIFQEVKASR